MKKFILFISIIIFALLSWLFSFNRKLDREYYLNEKVLAKIYPIDVTIDLDLIKSLNPAYE